MNARCRTPQLDEKVRKMRKYMTCGDVAKETGLSTSTVNIIMKGIKDVYNGGPRRYSPKIGTLQQAFLSGRTMEGIL
jgi:hypothetical protein